MIQGQGALGEGSRGKNNQPYPIVWPTFDEIPDHILGRTQPILGLEIQGTHAATYIQRENDIDSLAFDFFT